MSEHEESANDLLHLGPGSGSKVERIKIESRHLRGQIAGELAQEDTHRFSDPQVQLMKFHGIYQQENRDVRQERKAAGEEKAYQFMVRTRIPGGRITAEQYLVHDELADRYANGTLRITTRQGFQLHGVLKSVLAPTVKAINEALLTTLAACGDVNRNVMACPAPVGDCAHRQIEDISQRIAQHLTPRSHAYHEIWIDGEQVKIDAAPTEESEPIYGPTYLPRKFKIGVTAPGDNCIDVYTQDIGLVPMLQDGHVEGFTVLIGGGMGMTHNKAETYPRLATPLCFVTGDEVLPVVEAIVKVQRDYGDRQNRKHARMKYVVEERGIDWFRDEVEQRLGYHLPDPRPITWHDAGDHLGWHRQDDGRWFVGIFVENGRIKDTETVQMRSGLRQVIAQFRPDIRLTPQQNILLTDITESQRAPLTALLASYNVPVDPDQVGTRRFALACPALPTCGLALAEAERALPAVIDQIEAELQTLGMSGVPLSIRMTGCPNGCARPYMGDIGFVGRTKDVYNIYVGGDLLNTRLNTLYASSIHVRDLAAVLRPLLALWKEQRLPEESFGDFCSRVGLEHLQEQVAEPAQETENREVRGRPQGSPPILHSSPAPTMSGVGEPFPSS